MGTKRQRLHSPIRVQVSRPSTGPSSEPTQRNTHIQVSIDGPSTSQSAQSSRSRASIRTTHVTRALEVVDLSNLLTQEDESQDMVDGDVDSFPVEEGFAEQFGVDEGVVEDPDEEQEPNESEQSHDPPTRLAQEWLRCRQTYLDELLRGEGLKDKSPNHPIVAVTHCFVKNALSTGTLFFRFTACL
ncbi:hypothetical protein HWV62_22283 [Athelia sp. TMB]|nr:hypothetical protein HWV62_22283 [Athelia sp. TMB]